VNKKFTDDLSAVLKQAENENESVEMNVDDINDEKMELEPELKETSGIFIECDLNCNINFEHIDNVPILQIKSKDKAKINKKKRAVKRKKIKKINSKSRENI
jgi:hypothetical protein